MSEFVTKPLDSVAEIRMGQSPDSSSYNNSERGSPFLQGCADFGAKFPDTSVFCDNPTQIAPEGSILISVRAPVGELNRADQKYCIGRGLGSIISKTASTDYIYYSLQLKRCDLERVSQGSTFDAINSTELKTLGIDFPTLPVQRKIARILTTVDNQIEKTEALIAKYQSIKQGMMHDLFTRGVDQKGRLRPPQPQAPHLYKISELGWIPKEWEVSQLESLYASPIRDFGSFSSTNLITFLDSGIPFIKSEMIGRNCLNWEGVMYISNKVHKLLKKSHVVKGNILFSKIGSALGKSVIYDGLRGECNSNAAVAKIDIDNRKASASFINDFLNFDIAQMQFKNMIVSLLPRINLGDMNRLFIPLPSLKEQEIAEKRLSNINGIMRKEKKYREAIIALKTGLMQDLLSGKVRVTPDAAA